MQIALALIAISLHWARGASGLSVDQSQAERQSLVSTSHEHQHHHEAAAGSVASGASASASSASERARHDNRRPVWAIAHMVNSIKELDYRLATGANAIEADVSFGPAGDPLWTYHGPPCDCWRHCYQREDFHDFLNYVRELALDTATGLGQNLSLLFLDLKLDSLDQFGKVRAGQELAKAIMGDLFIGTHGQRQQASGAEATGAFNLILSINHVSDLDLVNNFIHTLEINNASQLMQQIGFDVGMNDELGQIDSMWRKLGHRHQALNLWQGDGFTNCFSPFYNLQRLSKALARRDQPHGYPAKVYHWTIDLHDRMRESLLLGVDAIMSNHPERLLAVLQEPEIAHDFRLATRRDNPFRKLARRTPGRAGETARYQRSAVTNGGGFLGNMMDVLTSWYAYMREIPLFSFPTTLTAAGRQLNLRRRQSPSSTSVSNETKATVSLTPVKLTLAGPEYKVENVSSIVNETLDTSDRSNNSGATLTLNASVNAAGETSQENQKQELDYQPPWYVSLVSNLLVSALRSVLPT